MCVAHCDALPLSVCVAVAEGEVERLGRGLGDSVGVARGVREAAAVALGGGVGVGAGEREAELHLLALVLPEGLGEGECVPEGLRDCVGVEDCDRECEGDGVGVSVPPAEREAMGELVAVEAPVTEDQWEGEGMGDMDAAGEVLGVAEAQGVEV